MSDEKKYPNGKHPNSLKNLVSFHNAKDANAMREKGLETRRRNKAEKEAMQAAVKAFTEVGVEVPDSETVLKIAMAKAISVNDMDEATRIAALLMPYEKPKLASQEISLDNKLDDKSDEELEELAASLGLVVDNTGTDGS
jgi:hypothetical protein